MDVAWSYGKASIVVLGRNQDGEVIGLWYNKLDFSSTLVIKLLAIKKACLVSSHFSRKEIQIESDCKVAVKVLLRINVCP